LENIQHSMLCLFKVQDRREVKSAQPTRSQVVGRREVKSKVIIAGVKELTIELTSDHHTLSHMTLYTRFIVGFSGGCASMCNAPDLGSIGTFLSLLFPAFSGAAFPILYSFRALP
jgi:inorganic pyrophosphatase/exopolyphosphatase